MTFKIAITMDTIDTLRRLNVMFHNNWLKIITGKNIFGIISLKVNGLLMVIRRQNIISRRLFVQRRRNKVIDLRDRIKSGSLTPIKLKYITRLHFTNIFMRTMRLGSLLFPFLFIQLIWTILKNA